MHIHVRIYVDAHISAEISRRNDERKIIDPLLSHNEHLIPIYVTDTRYYIRTREII